MTTTYTKSDLVAEVAAETDETKAHVERLVTAVLATIIKRAAESRVGLKGFGSFETRERAERNGRNPQTGEEMRIAASRRLHFRPARSKAE